MDTYRKVGRAQQDLKWARIWFKQFSIFHYRLDEGQRPLTADEVGALLRSKRDVQLAKLVGNPSIPIKVRLGAVGQVACVFMGFQQDSNRFA